MRSTSKSSPSGEERLKSRIMLEPRWWGVGELESKDQNPHSHCPTDHEEAEFECMTFNADGDTRATIRADTRLPDFKGLN